MLMYKSFVVFEHWRGSLTCGGDKNRRGSLEMQVNSLLSCKGSLLLPQRIISSLQSTEYTVNMNKYLYIKIK